MEFTRRRVLGGLGAGIGVVAIGCGSRHTPTAKLSNAPLRKFVASLDGRAIMPDSRDYDSAREVWNHAFDKRPGMIVMCAGAADVQRTLELVHENDLFLAVRSGRHSLAGKSTCDGGVVMDLSGLKKLHVDPAKRVARAQAGLLLADLDQATAAHGLATTSGTEPTTGIAGLTLGGGLGWLMGKHGLACDNLRAVEIVLADGRMVTASRTENTDLFWAVRGAGANFGVVTELEYDLHPVETILGGVIKFPHESLRDVLKHYREFSSTIPDEVGMSLGILPSTDGKPLASIAVSYCGDLKEGARVLEPLRSFRPVVNDSIKPMPYVAYQALGGLPPELKLHAFVRSGFLKELSDDAIEVIAANAAMVPPLSGGFVIERMHGNAARIPVTATAFPHRFTGDNFSLHADWLAPSGKAASMEWGASFWRAMQPFVRSAVYSNYLGDESAQRARDAYGENYPRLSMLKRKYDPSNLFSSNQNIAPA